jgi:hypothetical protein
MSFQVLAVRAATLAPLAGQARPNGLAMVVQLMGMASYMGVVEVVATPTCLVDLFQQVV